VDKLQGKGKVFLNVEEDGDSVTVVTGMVFARFMETKNICKKIICTATINFFLDHKARAPEMV
jgi:hypothetical protein